MSELFHNTKSVMALKSQSVSAAGDVVGEVIDTLGFKSVNILASIGDNAVNAANTLAIKSIAESTVVGMTNSVAIPATRIQGTAATPVAPKNTVVELGVTPAARYIQATFTKAGTTAITISALAVKGIADLVPTQV